MIYSPCKVVPIDGDGSCLFSSISYLLCGNVQSSFVARQVVVDYIISNWDRFKVFTHDHQGNNYPSREAYKTAMLNPMTYGSASELQAASEVFSCRFSRFFEITWSVAQSPRVAEQCDVNIQSINQSRFFVMDISFLYLASIFKQLKT
ncbi:p87 vp80 [Trichonephila clavipes]|nr:p87 vp80 [Trichonephila clavipes]